MDVKPAALQRSLGLPLVVHSGSVGRIEIKIPWTKLHVETTRLQVDRVTLLVVPQSSWSWDDAAEERRAIQRKLQQLAKHEAQRLTTELKKQAGRESFFSKLAMKALQKLEVDVTNIIIRYVDGSHGLHDYSVSLAMEVACRTAALA
eukprot:6193184-Pleurochrysis_carterae.AAC.1